MAISLIAAVARGGAIGREGKLPWRLPEDLAHFKRTTMGHPVLMGRGTWQTIGRPLAGRRNLVLSRDPRFSAPGCEVVRDLRQVEAIAAHEELFVIGGATVFGELLPVAERMYLTHIDAEIPGDRFFPAVDWTEWRLTSERAGRLDEANPLPCRFAVYERVGRRRQP